MFPAEPPGQTSGGWVSAVVRNQGELAAEGSGDQSVAGESAGAEGNGLVGGQRRFV